jgi:hypothetical protein
MQRDAYLMHHAIIQALGEFSNVNLVKVLSDRISSNAGAHAGS